MESKIYNEVVLEVTRQAYPHFIQPTDADDIVQDVMVEILETDYPLCKDDRKKIVSKYVGKYRQQRSRDRDRLIPIPQGVT